MKVDLKVGNKDLYTNKGGYYLILDEVFNIKVSKKSFTKIYNYLKKKENKDDENN